jgi:hypothetical protein
MESTVNGLSEEKYQNNKRQYTCHGFTKPRSGGVESGPVGETVLTPFLKIKNFEMKLRAVALFYNDRCIKKEKEEKLIHGDDYRLPYEDYAKRICVFYNVDLIYPCDQDDKYSCLVSGGEVFVVCMPIDKLEKRIEKAQLESLLKYSMQ